MEQVTQSTNPSVSRDYDKDPIEIKNYSVYFQGGLFMFIIVFVLALWISDFNNGRFEQMHFYSFEFFRIMISIVFIAWFINYLFKLSKRFQRFPSIFVFKSMLIEHTRYLYDKDENTQHNTLHAYTSNVSALNYCVMVELPYQYGRWHHLTPWQLYRKSSIGVHIGKTTLFLRYLITYSFLVLPYKLWRLYRAGEPLSLLKKNIFIQFNNRNYFLVNIYSQKELDDLIEYFRLHDIQISDKTYFIPHLQNDGPFADKEEVWTNEFKNQGEK